MGSLKTSGRLYDRHQISFAAQDEELTRAWRPRTGLPLSFLKQRWEELSAIPTQADAFTSCDPASNFGESLSLSSPSLAESRTGSSMPLRPTMAQPQAYNLTRAWTSGYMDRFPGLVNLSKYTIFQLGGVVIYFLVKTGTSISSRPCLISETH
jgi:hypothetical protein